MATSETILAFCDLAMLDQTVNWMGSARR